jgi:hypothetical protein
MAMPERDRLHRTLKEYTARAIIPEDPLAVVLGATAGASGRRSNLETRRKQNTVMPPISVDSRLA